MQHFRSFSTALGMAATVATLTPTLTFAKLSSQPVVFATGLEAPRGLRFGPDGYLSRRED